MFENAIKMIVDDINSVYKYFDKAYWVLANKVKQTKYIFVFVC